MVERRQSSSTRSALRERDFRLAWLGQTTSSFGGSLATIALAFAVLRSSDSPSALGGVLGVDAAALIATLLFGGVVADRISRRSLMVGADIARAALETALGLAVVLGRPSPIVIGVFAAMQGAAQGFYAPASTGFVPEIVSARNLPNANVLLSVSSPLATVFGMAAGGAIVSGIGPGAALIIDGATFAVNAVLLAAIRIPERQAAERSRMLMQLREGWSLFRRTTWLWAIVIEGMAFNLLFAFFMVLGPVISRHHYHGATSWAIVLATANAGGALGGVLVARTHPRHPLRVGSAATSLFALLPICFALHLPIAVVAAAGAVGWLGALVFNAHINTAIQTHIPADKISRMSSFEWLGSLLAYPIGLAVAGVAASAIGTKTLLLISGVLFVPIGLGPLALRELRNLTSPTVEPTSAEPPSAPTLAEGIAQDMGDLA